MRILAVLAFFIAASPSYARNPPIQVALALDAAQTFEGSSSRGDDATYKITPAAEGSIHFDLQADNENCGVEMRTTSQLGYLPKITRFPASKTFSTVHGQSFTVTFYQSRDAWMKNVNCAFSFTVQ